MKLKKIQMIFILMMCCLPILCGCHREPQAALFDAKEEQKTTESEEQETEKEQTEATETTGMIYVQVCGAVKKPGVVTLPAGSRAFEAISLAGGLTKEAAESSVNQAQVLSDGQQLVVWTKEEMEKGIVSQVKGQQEEGEQIGKKVNINTATASELMTLSGIGESRATDIIAYREENGGFQSIEEIMNISGIKEAIFEKIKDQITVS